MQLGISVGSTTEVSLALAALAVRLGQALEPAMLAATATLHEHIVADKLSGSPLKVRSGELRNSITSAVTASEYEARGVIATSVPYARIQEFGGRINARAAANLTIPLAAALGGDGQARFRARDLIASPALGGFTGTFVRRQILFGKLPGGTLVPLFKLQHSVELRARSFFGSALTEKRDQIFDLFRAAVAQTL